MASEVCAELLLVRLPEPARHRDPSTPQGAVLQEYYDKVQTFAGVQTVYWSARVEDPSKGLFVILWDSFSAAMEAAKHPDLGPLIAKTAAALAVPPTILYVTPASSPQPALESPATEVILTTFPADTSTEVKAAWEPAVPTLLREGGAASAGMRGDTGGWMAGGIPYSRAPGPSGAEEGSTAWVHFVGWDSVAAHQAWRETDGFKEHVHLIRGKGEKDIFHIEKS